MTIAKQSARKVIDSLPDDTSYDEILKELAFNRMIERGLEDSKNDRTISNEEMKQKIKQWQNDLSTLFRTQNKKSLSTCNL